MVHDRFDSASRYLIKMEPAELIRWRLKAEVAFRGCLDTRTIPFPGTPERLCDTVSRCEEASGQPWAIPLESQTRPDPDMFGRVLAYLGLLSLGLRPDEEAGSRFRLGAVVFNLTGRGNTSRSDSLKKAQLQTCLKVQECDLAGWKAGTVLRRIRQGEAPRCVLGWIPLMQNGADPAILRLWKRLAGQQPNPQRRADYGALALLFAELAGCLAVWQTQLEGWNVTESQVVLQWQAQARREGELRVAREDLRVLLEDRFGPLPPSILERIQATNEVARLQDALRQVHRMNSLDELPL